MNFNIIADVIGITNGNIDEIMMCIHRQNNAQKGSFRGWSLPFEWILC